MAAVVRRTGAPASEPVTLAEAKLHLAVTHTDHDALISSLITAAREQAEHRAQRSLIDQQWTLSLDAFPPEIELLMGRVTSVTSIQYVDPDGVTQSLPGAGAYLDNRSDYAQWLVPAYGTDWPVTRDEVNAVTVVYRAGEASAANVPAGVKQWILLLVEQWYDNRAAGAEREIREQPRPFWDGLLDPIRVLRV